MRLWARQLVQPSVRALERRSAQSWAQSWVELSARASEAPLAEWPSATAMAAVSPVAALRAPAWQVAASAAVSEEPASVRAMEPASAES